VTSIQSNHILRRDVIVTVDDSVRPRLTVADDHTMFAHLLASSLRDTNHSIAAVFDGTENDLASAIVASSPDLVLLDLHLGAEHDPSIPLLGELVESGLQVIVVTASEDRFELAACLEAGAIGFVSKSSSLESMTTAIADALHGRHVIPAVERQSLMIDLRAQRAHQSRSWEPFDRLTQRETDVLRLLCDGKPASEIAEMSYVSITTVRSQIRSVLAKLGVSSQLTAVAMARKARWLDQR
jgi:DNA-binding NarL/FixJ family response regulator